MAGGLADDRGDADAQQASVHHYLATSPGGVGQTARRLHRAVRSFTLPAPRPIVRPVLLAFLTLRGIYHFLKRVCVCEPLFKAYCTRHGRGLRTGTFLHWVQGSGDIVVGDCVKIDGKCTFTFASRFAERPVLEIGDNTGIGHGCTFVVGRRIVIGRNCIISGDDLLLGSSGHRADAAARARREPPAAEEVRDIVLGDNVWIGLNCILFPGVRIGEGSVVSAGSVVRTHVPPYAVVAGNPARIVFRLSRPC